MFEATADPKKPKGEYPATTNRIVATFGGNRLVSDLAAEDFELLRDVMAKHQPGLLSAGIFRQWTTRLHPPGKAGRPALSPRRSCLQSASG
jgi:hypothetical protein